MARLGPQDYLVSGINASGVGSTMDCRNALPAAYHSYWAAGNSAVLSLEASPDGTTGWNKIATVTATTAQVSTALYSAYYPFVRAGFVTGWQDSTGYVSWMPALTQRY